MFTRIDVHNRPLKMVYVVFLALFFSVSVIFASYFEDKLKEENESRITNSIESALVDIKRDIQQTLEIYSLELKNIRAFIYNIGFDELSHQRFLTYAQDSQFEENYPGARGFGFIKYIEPKDEAEYLVNISADRESEFQIKTLFPHNRSRFVIEYIEPEYKNAQAVGLDIGSEDNRRYAALAAAHQNKVTLTAPITLVQADSKVQHGFLLLYPVYLKAQSESGQSNDVFGWAYAPLLIDEILQSIQQQKSGLKISLKDVTSTEVIDFFEGGGDNENKNESASNVSTTIDLFGRVWEINAKAKVAFIDNLTLESPERRYYQILVILGLIGVLLTSLLYIFQRRVYENQQKRELAAVIENGIEGTIGIDQNFCLKYWNDAAKALFGFDEKSYQIPIVEWFQHSLDSDEIMSLFRRISSGESIKGFEVNLVDDVSNEARHLHLNFQPIHNKGVFLGANVSMVDLTELQTLHTELEEKNRLLSIQVNRQDNELKVSSGVHESLIDGADLLIVTTDLLGRISSINRKCKEWLGYEISELMEKPVTDIISKQALAAFSAKTQTDYKLMGKNYFESLVYPLRHQPRLEQEFNFQHKNSQKIPLQLSISVVKTTQEEQVGYLFIADDLRNKRQEQFDLSIIEEAIRNSDDVLLWLNQFGDICFCNPHAANFLGYSEFDLKRMNISDVLQIKTGENWRTLIQALSSSKKIHKTCCLINRKSQKFPFLMSLVPSNIGGELYIFCSAKNLSVLEQKEKGLEQSLAIATEANLSKDHLLSNMGHTLRTPLNEVHGALQLIQLTDLSPVQVEYVSQAKNSVRILTGAIDDVIELGEIIQNKLPLLSQKVNLLDLLSSIGQLLAPIAEDKSIEVHFDFADDLPEFVNTDPDKVTKLILSLMSNAIKYTNDGDVILRCQLIDIHEDEYELRFEVVDTGIGMSRDKQQDILKLFSEACEKTDKVLESLGLGLAITKNIVELMSGKITCQSEEGKGTSFSFTLKVGRPSKLDSFESDPLSSVALNVLVVDDNKISLSVLSRLVTQLGWQVTTVNNASQAIDAIKNAKHAGSMFDLSLIDWNMPEKSGVDLVKDIRAQFSEEDMPILVMVSAHTRKMLANIDNRDIENLLSAFLTKPVTKNMLLDLVHSVLGSPAINSSGLHGRQKLHGYRILLVDDNESNRFIGKNLLQTQGAEIVLAKNGEEAWSVLNSNNEVFDIVLMDLQMPGWDGYETTRIIRSDTRFQDLPILAMTASVLAADKRRCAQAGMNGHIGKPFELMQLVQEIIQLAKKPGLILGYQAKSKNRNIRSYQLEGPSIVIENDVLKRLQVSSNINIESSLQRFAGSESLYVQSLKMFIGDLESYNSQLRGRDNLILTEIKPIFHTLKGTSALLGFLDLSNLALECEQLASLFVEKGADVEPLTSLLDMIKEVKEKIEQAFLEQGDSKSAQAENQPDLDTKKLNELRRHLESSNMNALSLFAELKGSIMLVSAELTEQLDTCLNQLKFKDALLVLEKIGKMVSESNHG